jgi:putative membrane protein
MAPSICSLKQAFIFLPLKVSGEPWPSTHQCFCPSSRSVNMLLVVRAKHVGKYFNSETADKEKEDAMVYRRMVFDHGDWMRHRSSTRHGRHLLSIASSRVILALGPPVLSLTGVSAAITFYNEAIEIQILPHWFPLLHISSLPFSLTAPVLALLLVFRTNASYARFDEARKSWGMTVNRTRDLCRQALTWMRSPADAPKLECFLRHLAAFPYTLKDHTSRRNELQSELAGVLEETELKAVMMASHRPNYVLQIMSELVYSTNIRDMERSSIDANITQFHDNVGACERIFKTPIPLSYTRLTSRFLVIWHLALPLGLWDICRWGTIPAVFFNAAALLCIEEVGVLIEEPFSTLALATMCSTIKGNLEDLAVAHAEFLTISSDESSKRSSDSSKKAVDGSCNSLRS